MMIGGGKRVGDSERDPLFLSRVDYRVVYGLF